MAFIAVKLVQQQDHSLVTWRVIIDRSKYLAMTNCTMSAIALGSNLGDSHATLESALQTLDRTPNITVTKHSSWYKTAPIGPSQPDYLNGCAILKVQLNPQELLTTLLDIEAQFNRVRQERWGPRTLDLDVLLFSDLILETPNLQIPHPRMTQRAFVLVPLAEIAPDWIEPVSGKSIDRLVETVDRSGVQKFDFEKKK